mmetsp:Transcript_38714/g.95048  ORF Transcript_38714/g.95048 Transcript_38714/m.95048 type:complete len:419 (-) Transcript_38714:20-1276(-)
MIRRLSCLRVLLRRITNDAVRRLVSRDLNSAHPRRPGRQQVRVAQHRIHHTLQSSSGLMLVQPELEMHPHHGKIRPGVAQNQVKRSITRPPPLLVPQCDIDNVLVRRSTASGGFEESEDGLGVAEDVLGPSEASHGTTHAQDGGLGGDCCGGSLAVGQITPRTDSTERDVVRHSHPNSTLNLLRRCPQQSPIHSSRSDRPVDHVVDLVALQREDLRQTPTNLIGSDHRTEGLLPVNATCYLRRCNHHGIEIVVPKLPRRVSRNRRVVPKHSPVRIPFPHSRRVGHHRLLRRHLLSAPKHRSAVTVLVGQSFITQHSRGVGLHRKGRHTAHHRVSVEHLDTLPDLVIHRLPILPIDKINSILPDPQCLVGVLGQDHSMRIRRECTDAGPRPVGTPECMTCQDAHDGRCERGTTTNSDDS